MGVALIKFKIMPEEVDTDLEAIKTQTKEKVEVAGGEVTKIDEEPIAFGLKALIAYIRIDETKGSDDLEASLKKLDNIKSSEIEDYRREL